MRAPRTLVSYVVREVLLYTVLGLATITVILVTRNLVRALDQLAAAGFLLSDLLTVARLLGLMLFIYALPVSFLFGILLAIGRMAADVEITAMRACGIGIRAITIPIVTVGLLLSLVTLHLTIEVEPAARRGMKQALQQMLVRGAAIEPGKFRALGERLVYVEERDREQQLRGIVISDRTDPEHPFIVFARSGAVRFDEASGQLVMELESGDIHVEAASPQDERYQHIAFAHFGYAIDLQSIVGPAGASRARDMTLAELAETAQRVAAGDTEGLREEPRLYALHWHRRFAYALQPALFALVGVPLAMRRTRGARPMGMLWCAGLAFAYYMISSLTEPLCLQGWIEPWLASQIANLAFAALGVLLLTRARRAGM